MKEKKSFKKLQQLSLVSLVLALSSCETERHPQEYYPPQNQSIQTTNKLGDYRQETFGRVNGKDIYLEKDGKAAEYHQ